MKISEATPEQIQAMQDRLNRRREDRWNDVHMDDAVRMVQQANSRRHHPAGSIPPRASLPSRENVIVATGSAAIAGAAALLGGTGAIPVGYAAIVTGVALAGAKAEVARSSV